VKQVLKAIFRQDSGQLYNMFPTGSVQPAIFSVGNGRVGETEEI